MSAGSPCCSVTRAFSGHWVTLVGDAGRSTPSCLCAFAKNDCRHAASFLVRFAVARSRFDVLRMGMSSSFVSCLIILSSSTVLLVPSV